MTLCGKCKHYVDGACKHRGPVDMYGDGSDISVVDDLAWWGSAMEYTFRPPPTFGCVFGEESS